jgi:hypothetical protein
MDPQDEGVAQKWAEADAGYPDRITVPGNWQAQGFGEPGGIARHNYQGTAWYRRSFEVPAEWAGKRVWLRFEGVCNWGKVFVDGAEVGRIETFITPYEFDITDCVTPGRIHRLDVMVDSRTPSGAPYVGMMQFLVPVGGITSHVRLDARPDPQLARVALRAEPGLKGVLTVVSVQRAQPGAAWRGRLSVRVLNVEGAPAAEGDAPLAIAAEATLSGTAELRLALADLRPWSPDDPYLYRVEVTLHDATDACDYTVIRTGFRTLVTDPGTGNFLLNGGALFLRGCGYDSLEPVYGSPPPDKGVYAKRLRHLRDCGFNAIRFLAHTPLREFFEAADEVGMLLQTEGEWFLAGTPMQPETGALLQAQVPRMIREFENHPSWYSFSCFNEAFNARVDPVKQAYIQAAHDTFRALKPDHYFVASDGGGDQWPTDIITDRFAMERAAGAAPGQYPPQQVFRGQVEEVALFHRALDLEAIQSLAAERPDLGAAPRNAAVRLNAALRWPQRVVAPGVSLADQAQTALPARGQPFTIAAWVRPDVFAVNDWGTFFSCGAAETGQSLILALDGQTGDGRLQIGRYMDNILRSQRALSAGLWSHVALTYDGQRVGLWLDGTPDAELEAVLDIPPIDIAIGRLVDHTLRTPADYASRPHVWHEFDNTYIAPLPDLDKEPRLTGAMTQAWVLEPHRRRLESYGLLERYPELRRRSIARYREYVKAVYERARHMPRLDGYAWWVVSDIPGGVETDVTDYGILDMFYEPEKFDPAWFRQINRESVLLIDAETDQRVLAAGESRDVKLTLSHYGTAPVEKGDLRWSVSAEGATLAEGSLGPLAVVPGTLAELGHIRLGPFGSAAPQEITLTVALNSAACRQTNQWRSWVFPAGKRGLPQAGVVNLTGEPLLDTRYRAGDSRALAGRRVALASTFTPELLDWVRAGGNAILLERNEQAASVTRPGVGAPNAPSRILRQAGALPYWPLWLRCDAQWVERHPALGDFPHDGSSGFQFMRLFSSGVPTVDFTPRAALARQHVEPIMAGLSLIPWTEDASRFNFALAYGAVLSECRVGEGRVLICTLWALDGVRRGYPEAGYLLDCLVEYAGAGASKGKLPRLSAEDATRLFSIENRTTGEH